MTNKYRTINGKIRHAHAPVGPKIDYDNESMRYCFHEKAYKAEEFREVSPQDVMMCKCGYHVCSKTGPCASQWKCERFDPGWCQYVKQVDGWCLAISHTEERIAYGVGSPGCGAFALSYRANTVEEAQRLCEDLYARDRVKYEMSWLTSKSC